jgi:hypothetical protein
MDTSSESTSGHAIFVVARNRHIMPKRRRIERLPIGYSVQESKDGSQGDYWFVIAWLKVLSRP